MAKPITIYGIKNCDTMKKARAWLDKRGIAYAFHDYKTEGIDRARLEQWCKDAGWETLLNRAGRTFRKLPESAKTNVDARKALRLMLDQPSMIKTSGAQARRRQARDRIYGGELPGDVRGRKIMIY